jgi:hypothetical protein
MLFAPHVVSAQDAPLVRFTVSGTAQIDSDVVYEITFGSSSITAVQDVMTKYYAMQPGAQIVEFASAGEGGSTTSAEVNFEAGNRYALISTGPDQPVIVVNETVAEEESGLAEGENALTIVTTLAAGNDAAKAAFKILDNATPTPQERVVFEYSGYLQSGIGTNGVVIQRLDPQTQAIMSSVNIPYFPNTSVIVNGDGLADATRPMVVNYSTTLSVADWLAGINQMANPPFTFSEFINSAVTGGFDAALAQCEDYMWFVWTDEAFAGQSSDNQSFISGGGAGVILNNSVLEGAITTPWLISPTATRGGTPLFVGDPLAELDSINATPAAGSVTGNILMTLSTSGNNVQNVIHITDTVPLGETADVRVENYQLFPSRTRLNLVLPLGSP